MFAEPPSHKEPYKAYPFSIHAGQGPAYRIQHRPAQTPPTSHRVGLSQNTNQKKSPPTGVKQVLTSHTQCDNFLSTCVHTLLHCHTYSIRSPDASFSRQRGWALICQSFRLMSNSNASSMKGKHTLHRKMFEQQMHALEQQQAQETEPSHRQQWKWSPAYGCLCAHLAPLVSTLSFLVPPRYLRSAPIYSNGVGYRHPVESHWLCCR
ncbi:hypothetical protein BC827DRAFT_931532 [Russula dissimulans]|nr:hypothetical protein BC827DRAFT_931532 [Russula dissimulans]